MSQAVFFDFEQRPEQLNAHGAPLQRLEAAVDFEAFRPTLARAHEKQRKGDAGRKPCDVVVMFRMLVIAMLYNLSNEQGEYQVRDRISCMGFLGLEPGDRAPDEKTLWLFRERLSELGLVDELFDQFNQHLEAQGFKAQQGNIVDADIVEAPKQRNTREDNARIKGGARPETFDENPAKGRQKDTDARWTVKRQRASVHDSQVLVEVLDSRNTHPSVHGESAYRSQTISAHLKENGCRDRIPQKNGRNKPLNEKQKARNKRQSKGRARVEHVFGGQSQFACHLGATLLRCIGEQRAEAQIGLQNLVYNLDRYRCLTATAQPRRSAKVKGRLHRSTRRRAAPVAAPEQRAASHTFACHRRPDRGAK
jgi:IS5 family transposase